MISEMKKNYLKPELEILLMETEFMIAATPGKTDPLGPLNPSVTDDDAFDPND